MTKRKERDPQPGDLKPSPCPWCKSKAEPYLNGSYVDGWVSFVVCSERSGCGARGPEKRTGYRSNEEWEIQDEAVKAWNKVAREKT